MIPDLIQFVESTQAEWILNKAISRRNLGTENVWFISNYRPRRGGDMLIKVMHIFHWMFGKGVVWRENHLTVYLIFDYKLKQK